MRRRLALGCLGLGGSTLMTLTAPRLAGRAVKWWFVVSFGHGVGLERAVFTIGMAALCAAWLGLRRTESSVGQLWAIGAAWCLPLLIAPPLFSHDSYSYLAQGTIAHLGLNPYRHAPLVLGHLGHPHLLYAVDRFWRGTTAPYGPLFLVLVRGIAALTGSNIILGVILQRLLEAIGLGLLAVFLPRLAESVGMDRARAVWLALLNPIVIFELLAPGHNDALLVGLLAAAGACALRGRPLLAIVLLALATTIKLPAVLAIVFIAVAWARVKPGGSPQLQALAACAAVAVAVIAAVSLLSGFGVSWISGSVFATPARVQLSITPATALGWTVAHFLHVAGIGGVRPKHLEATLEHITFVLVCVFALALLRDTTWRNLASRLGLALLAFAIGGPAAWPWYLTWGLVFLAVVPWFADSRAFAVACALLVFLVKPNGEFAVPLQYSPYFVAFYLVAALVGLRLWRRRSRSPAPGVDRSDGGATATTPPLAEPGLTG